VPDGSVAATVAAVPLVDHHVHGALRRGPDRAGLEAMLSESDRPVAPWMTQFDSQLGLAVRRWCAPLLGLEPLASAEEYVARRGELGEDEVTRRMLTASGVEHYLVETGFLAGEIRTPAEMAQVAGVPADEVVRLESVFEEVAREASSAAAAVRAFPDALAERSVDAVGLKSVVAYRIGFDFDPGRPDVADVVAATGALLAAAGDAPLRVADPVLLRHLLWAGIDRGLPLQLHAGYGDPDLELHRCDPLLLTRFIKLVEPHGVDLLLLHCYPYHRNAGYLAQVFPHVYFDVGLGVNHTGLRSDAVIAESLELAPFAKILFSSDAWGPAELHFLGAHLWRRGVTRALSAWVDDGEASAADAARIAGMVGRENARRVYRLDAR
jgi:predicted TIM-barrel fold metal-dependent hydrolase